MKKALAGTAVVVGAVVGFPAVAAAAPAQAASPLAAVSSYGVTPSAVPANCFGFVGNFKDGSSILVVDWTGDGQADECFGIAPNRHIYHAWRTHAWVEMPNGGLADDTDFATFVNGFRTVAVFVNGKGDYCSSLITTWRPWTPC